MPPFPIARLSLLLQNEKDIGALVPMGFLHAVSHLTVVLGLGAGAVSFLQTVKASEACFTALLSYLFLGQVRHTVKHSSVSLKLGQLAQR